jgi:hypothetical protein
VLHHVPQAIQIAWQTPRLRFTDDAVDYYQFLGDDVVEGQPGAFVDSNKPPRSTT